jgi:two-component system, sensor histidine kinase FlrB
MTRPRTESNQQSQHLRAAFIEFEDASHKLSDFHRALESKLGSVTEELRHSRLAQARELADKQRIAARLGSLLDALPGGVVVLDQYGAIQEFNPAAIDLLGEMRRGDSWMTIVARAFAPRAGDGHDISLVDGRLVNIATQALSREPGQILLLKDVTETRRLQDQLAHHKRLSTKVEMAAALAHQIRTPLATALLNTSNLLRTRSEEARERAIYRSLKSLRKLERVVDEMLLFARGRSLSVDVVDVTDLVSQIETSARQSHSSDEFKIVTSEISPALAVAVNRDALISVALNLIDNASQACRGRGVIGITANAVNGLLELVFHDSGPGIDTRHAENIFEPFFTTRPNGTGLGLAVARAVVRAHGGELDLAASTSGAQFVLRLPIHSPVSPSGSSTDLSTHTTVTPDTEYCL